MPYVVPAALLACCLVALGVARYGYEEARYGIVATGFLAAVAMLVLALRATDVRGKSVAALLVSAIAFAWGWWPATDEGEEATLVFAAGAGAVALAGIAILVVAFAAFIVVVLSLYDAPT